MRPSFENKLFGFHVLGLKLAGVAGSTEPEPSLELNATSMVSVIEAADPRPTPPLRRMTSKQSLVKMISGHRSINAS